ncbi:S49 family peptidase [Spirosoma fluminis]
MNKPFRTVSAFMRHTWLIEPVFAEQHLPIVNAYLTGSLPLKASEDDEEESSGESITRLGFALAPTAAGSADAPAHQTATADRRYALDDPELPENSVFVVDIRGAIFKESTCCSYGTEDYCRAINQAYANEKIIGVVCLIDSPGGQLSGTPTLYDVIRDPKKPTVSVVNEGLMASAAYWLACGSDFIYATQKTDQIGSIGVFVTLRDSREALAKEGIKNISVYSDRSTQKNKPYLDALEGDTTLLREDLNQAADLFREAVEEGRGARLKPATKDADVFNGGLFYAGKAIELGLIDGYGNLDTAVAKVVELHTNRTQPDTSTGQTSPQSAVVQTNSSDSSAPNSAPITSAQEVTPEPAAPTAAAAPLTLNSNPNPNSNDMLGLIRMTALAGIKGIAAADVTADQITAINAEFEAAGFNVAVVSESDIVAAQTLQADLNTANAEITRLKGENEKLGKQPGHLGSKSEKTDEKTAGDSEASDISDTDAELKKMKATLGIN